MSTRWSHHERGDGTDHTETAEGDIFKGRVISACKFSPGKSAKEPERHRNIFSELSLLSRRPSLIGCQHPGTLDNFPRASGTLKSREARAARFMMLHNTDYEKGTRVDFCQCRNAKSVLRSSGFVEFFFSCLFLEPSFTLLFLEPYVLKHTKRCPPPVLRNEVYFVTHPALKHRTIGIRFNTTVSQGASRRGVTRDI